MDTTLLDAPKSSTIGTCCKAYDVMMERCQLLTDLMGGTLAMRAAQTTWLPMEPREEPEAYDVRVKRAVLYGALRDTVDKLVAKPFSRPVSLKEGKLPRELAPLMKNVDLMGTDLTSFVRSVFRDSLVYGLSHVLVDFPKVKPETLADEDQLRPYFIHVPARNLIGYRTKSTPAGDTVVTEIRIKEQRVEAQEDYTEKVVEYLRLWNSSRWEVWSRDVESENDFTLRDSGENSLGFVPLVTFYAKQTGVLAADPPLEDLAWLNLAHWQSFSDQRNILRFARVGILFLRGISEEEYEEGVTVGPSKLVRTTNSDADMKYVEYTGQAIGAGRQDLQDLEARMQVLGLSPYMETTGGSTATGRALDEARTMTTIQTWIRDLEDFVTSAFKMAGRYYGESRVVLDDSVRFEIFKDFGLSMKAADEIRSLILARQAGEISRETFLDGLKRRGLLEDGLVIAEEVARLEKEHEQKMAEDKSKLEAEAKVKTDAFRGQPASSKSPEGEEAQNSGQPLT